MKTKIDPYIAVAFAVPATCLVACLVASCTPAAGTGEGPKLSPEGKELVANLASEACKEGLGRRDDLVEVLCNTGGQVFKVLLPRKQWTEVRAARASAPDAGPGK